MRCLTMSHNVPLFSSTDPITLAGEGAVTAHQDCLDLMSGQTHFEDKRH